MGLPAWPPKDGNEVLDYQLDWSFRLSVGDLITASTWIPPDGDLALLVNDDTFAGTTTTVWLSAGTAGQTYRLTNQVVTQGGRTMEQSVTIRIGS